jgi:predicted ATPase/DNA-binding SARP family transcriptional activator
VNEQLRLDLLGNPRIEVGGRLAAGFVSSKALALLAYLAVMPGHHRRESLATLLWSETREHDARASLRVVLSNLRKVLGSVHLDTSRATVALVSPGGDWLDVERFDRLVREASLSSDDATDTLRAAVNLYRGDFLAGIDINGAPVWEEWLTVQRERLRQSAVRVMYALAVLDTAAGRYDEGVNTLNRLLALDPWHEDAHRQMMLLLVYLGQRNAALVHYAQFRRDILSEVGTVPEPDTVALFERIRLGAIDARDGGNAAPSISTQQTSFVGRARELALIASTLANPECRLLTLIGPGGVGKSRLAEQAMLTMKPRYPGGAVVIRLAPVEAPAFIVPAIAAGLGIPLVGSGEPTYQLLREIRGRRIMLILDSFEHLVDGADVLREILDGAPATTFLVTSRERLGLGAEWLITVDGLSVPASSNLETVAGASAVTLFQERARRADPTFLLSERNAGCVARICAALDGMPLAIELAAAWIRTHSCAEIESSILGGFDFLTTTGRDLPRRHRSMRAVFDHSWVLLTEREQQVFQSLSVFRGGFTAHAAGAIASASAGDLRDLADKSLLHRRPDGRYALHGLLRRYAAERLAESRSADDVAGRHAAYFASLLALAEPGMKDSRQADLLVEVESEIDNIRAAWQWMVVHCDDRLIVKAVNGLCLFHDLRGGIGEAWDVVVDALAALRHVDTFGECSTAARMCSIGLLAGWQARFAEILGRFELSESLMARSLALLSSLDAESQLAYRLDTQGMNANARGDQDEAIRLQQAALAESDACGDRLGVSLALNRLGGIAFDTGRFPEAQVRFEQSLVVRREIGDWQGVARDYSNLGEVARLIGDFAEARRLLDNSVVLFRERGSNWRLVLPLENLGELCLCTGKVEDAEQFFREALAIVETLNEQRHVVIGMLGLGGVAIRRGEIERARGFVMESAARARANGIRQCVVQCRRAEAQLSLATGDAHEAARVGHECLALARELGNAYEIGRAEIVLGRAALAAAQYDEAAQSFQAASSRLRATGARPAILDAACGLAEVAASMELTPDQADQVVERLTFVSNHRSAWAETRSTAEAWLRRLDATKPVPGPMRSEARLSDVLKDELLLSPLMTLDAPAGPRRESGEELSG